jgi:hypothetical protein
MKTLLPAPSARALAAVFFAFALSIPLGGDDLLKVEGSIRPRRLAPEQEGRVVLKLSIPPDILIIPQPYFIIEFTSVPEIAFPKTFFTASDLEMEVREEEGGLSLVISVPIEIPFRVLPAARRGSHVLEGRIRYFALSTTEGWFLKTASKFSIPFVTTSPPPGKK